MNLYIRQLKPLYELGTPISLALLRVFCGVALMVHGWPKMQDMFGNIEMVENLGFYPGVFWSPALALTEFVGGLLLAVGLLTRFAASGTFIVLSVAAYAHWVAFGQGYSGAEKAILWAFICLFFAFHGAGKLSVDGAIGKEI